MKSCSKCKEVKDYSQFSPDKRTKTGCQSRCKICQSEHIKLKYSQNPEHFRKMVANSAKKHYSKVLNRNSEYRKNNPEKVYAWKAKDRLVNKARVLADNAMRRSKIPTRVTKEVKQIYALRDFYCSMSLGEKFHVDHITPISTGGLHIIENLQILPAIDNLRKGAK